jgi:transcriptional regulator with XRE-family HTH domain
MATAENPFGSALREWRARRRMSQLELGLAANVSARHVAFLETGRSRPSRNMAMQLGEALEMPRGERNRLLEAAGFRAPWSARPLDGEEMTPVRKAIARMTRNHDPWPAVVLDRHWRLLEANRSGGAVFSALGVAIGGSALDAFVHGERARAMIENWPEVARHLLQRLRTESAHLGGDAVLDAAIGALAADPALARHSPPQSMPALVPVRYLVGGQRFSVFSTIAQFGTAEDLVLADMKIELLFPADAATEAAFSAL